MGHSPQFSARRGRPSRFVITAQLRPATQTESVKLRRPTPQASHDNVPVTKRVPNRFVTLTPSVGGQTRNRRCLASLTVMTPSRCPKCPEHWGRSRLISAIGHSTTDCPWRWAALRANCIAAYSVVAAPCARASAICSRNDGKAIPVSMAMMASVVRHSSRVSPRWCSPDVDCTSPIRRRYPISPVLRIPLNRTDD